MGENHDRTEWLRPTSLGSEVRSTPQSYLVIFPILLSISCQAHAKATSISNAIKIKRLHTYSAFNEVKINDAFCDKHFWATLRALLRIN